MRGHIHKRRYRCVDGTESTTFYVVLDVEKHADGRRRQRWYGGFSTRDEAERARAQLAGELRTAPRTSASAVSLSEWVLGAWLPSMVARVKPTTFASYRGNMELHVLPVLGAYRLSDVTPQVLNRLYARLLAVGGPRGPLSPKTVHYIHMTIHKALADALDAEVVEQNAASRAKPPRPSIGRLTAGQVWELGELACFLEYVRGTPLGPIWRLAALTGMRRGEVLGLRWGDIDFRHRRVAVRRARVVAGSSVIESTPKGGTGRVIDVDGETADQLRAHHAGFTTGHATACEPHPSDPVATTDSGDPIHPDAFSQLFRRLIKAAGLRAIRLHDLRHTHGSQALRAGVSVKVVSERLGHRSPAFTLAAYAHVIPGMQAEAATRVAGLVDGAGMSLSKQGS